MQLTLKKSSRIKMDAAPGVIPTLLLFITLKIVLSFWGAYIVYRYPTSPAMVPSALPFYERLVPQGFQQGQTLVDLTVWPWFRWDTEWYLRIAVDGYQPGGSTSFAPIYPFLIHLLTQVGIHPIFAALIISNTALVFTCLLLYKEALEHFDSPTAFRALLYFLVFPSAVFLFAAYTETLFALFLLLAWRFGRRRRWLWMSVFGSLAVLTRFQGVFLALPLGYLWWKNRKGQTLQGLYLILIPVGVLAWSLFVKFGLKADFPWDALQAEFHGYYAWPWNTLWHGFQSFTGSQIYIPDFLDFTLSILFIGLTVVAAFKLPGEYSLLMFAVVMPGLVKVALNYPLMSMSRYLLPVFPGFLLLAHFGRKRLFNWLWLIFSITLMVLAAGGFFLWQWVA